MYAPTSTRHSGYIPILYVPWRSASQSTTPKTALSAFVPITTSFSFGVEEPNHTSAHPQITHTSEFTYRVAHAMKLSLLLLSALLLPSFSAASPTPTPPQALLARAAITSSPTADVVFRRRNDPYAPSIAPFSLSLNLPSIAAPSIPSLSLNLPVETCTPGFPSYATPGVDGYVPAGSCNALWVYFPNFAAATAFAVLFGVLLVVHLGQATQYKNGFCWVIIMAAIWETGAYAFRALGSKDQQSAGIATVAQILVLAAPICES